MDKGKLSPKLWSGLLVAIFFIIALSLRVYLPYDQIFTANGIKFNGTDAYYYMRLVDNLTYNLPHLMTFDPFLIFPGGEAVSNISFFARLLATISWVIGLGSPTKGTIDVVSVYFPAVLGALTVIPVYFIGKALLGRWAGVLSAGLIALLPGEFLGRSILGSTDHHVAETLFSTVTILFLILAIKTASERRLTFNHLRHLDWVTSAKPIIYSLLAGIFLGTYLLTWMGGLLFVFIIFAYFVIQFIIDHLKQRSSDYLCLVGVTTFFVAAIMFLPMAADMFHLTSMLIALLTPLVLSGLSKLMTHKKIKLVHYPLTLVGLGLAGIGLLYLVNPLLLETMLAAFSIFAPTGAQLTTTEMQPIFFPGGSFSFAVVWGNFTTSFFLSLICLGVLIYLVIKYGSAEKTLLVVWSLVILATTLGQRRFAYYFAVNVAVLTGYLSWQFLSRTVLKELTSQTVKIPKKEVGRKKARSKKNGFRATSQVVIALIGLIIIFFVIYFPNLAPATATASQARFAPSDAWSSSLSWLKENTPDPFGNPDFYYHLEQSTKYRSLSSMKKYIPNPSGDPNFYYQLEASYKYPESAYGVMAWWDYGYWITRIAHRMPNANPSQDPRAVTSVARFFTSPDEKSANKITEELRTSYIVIDYDTATSKFWAIATWAGKNETDFFDIYYLPQENRSVVPVRLYYPEYYRSLSTRLYNFDGKAVTPQSTMVISYQEMPDQKGNLYKVITGKNEFKSYQEAEAYLQSQQSANYKIVGTNPFISPVPLEALERYKLIHSSDSSLKLSDTATVPELKIFEYSGD